MSEDATQPEQPEKMIHLPAPPGHRRGMVQWKFGFTKEFDLEPEELVALVRDFLAGDEPLLELHDAQFGEPWWLTRAGAEDLIGVCVTWVTNPAPQEGRRGGVVVARDMPRGRRPRLN